MKTFKVALPRTYLVEIEASDEKQAKFLTEFFLSFPRDASSAKEKAGYAFRFKEIEMVTNEAFKAEEIIV